MSKFMSAMNNAMAFTANGAATHATSGDRCVDLFFQIGSSRGKDLTNQFMDAYNDCPDYAIRIIQYARDVRGGMGERKVFIDLLTVLSKVNRELALMVLMNTPEIGRWKDVVEMIDNNSPIKLEAIALISLAICEHKNGLAAKWAPRKGATASALARFMQLSAKEYRKLIVGLSDTVEQKMCARQWDMIEFNKLPSVASSRYQKTFLRRATESYKAYLESLEKGETTINAGALYPYDIIKSVQYGGNKVASIAQWNALPDFMNGTKENIMAVVDVSGSMECSAGGNKSISCMDVAMSLGIYISERNTGAFKDLVMTFSANPQFMKLSGDVFDRLNQLRRADWGYNTDLNKAFRIMLQRAQDSGLDKSDMPTKMIILSDMEFDACDNRNQTNFDAIEKLYSESGYTMPKIVFWNLNARSGNLPVKAGRGGAALVSGFSPAIMKSLLGNEDMSPRKVMIDAIMSDRYIGLNHFHE